MGLCIMRMLVFGAIIIILPVATKSQEATCDVHVPCTCCEDGGISCATNQNDYCDGSCKDGYYGARCIQHCPAECISCHQQFGKTNECFKCIDGRYGKACTEVCSNCARCNKTTGVCVECADGYYGQNCTSSCSKNCVDLSCNSVSGRCFNCIAGYYGDMCTDKCSNTCQNTLCDRMSGVCEQCVIGYYGAYCHINCSENCLDMCNMVIGICTGCVSGMYGKYCKSKCPSSCSGSLCEQVSGTCTNGCLENFDGDKCEDCIAGKYGTRCDLNCPPSCLYGVCARTNGACESGCKPGYSDSQLCCVNNINCHVCSSPSECTQCVVGKYGQKCEHSCPDTCDGSCAKTDGSCNQCILNNYGSRCENHCSETCFTNDGHLSRCKSDNGKCQFGCMSSFYGDMCKHLCSEHCNLNCDTTSGECHTCKYNRYGNVCEHLCFHACVRIDGETVCNKNTGICLHGCLNGFYGDICDKSCSSGCQNKSCERHRGHCSNGCTENFSGQFCVAARNQTDSQDSSSVTIGVSLGLAFAVLLTAAVASFIFRKRIISLLKRRDLPQSSSTYDDLNAELRATGGAYSGVSYDNANNDRDDRVYINTTMKIKSDATEQGHYVNML